MKTDVMLQFGARWSWGAAASLHTMPRIAASKGTSVLLHRDTSKGLSQSSNETSRFQQTQTQDTWICSMRDFAAPQYDAGSTVALDGTATMKHGLCRYQHAEQRIG